MDFLPKSLIELLASLFFIFSVVFSFFSLKSSLRGHSIKASATFAIIGLSIISNHWSTYFAAMFIVATAVTELDFLRDLAAIIRGDKNYFSYKAAKSSEGTITAQETHIRARPNRRPTHKDQDYQLFEEGNTYLQRDNLLEAEKKYLEVINRGANNSAITNSYLNLAVVYMKFWHQTRNDEYLNKSIASSRKALELDPDGYRSKINLAIALSKNRATEKEALQYFEEADEQGDLRDPISWGKVKLFKASLLATLSSRPSGKEYEDRLPEAELDITDALRLFESSGDHPEVPWLIHESNTTLNIIRKKIMASSNTRENEKSKS